MKFMTAFAAAVLAAALLAGCGGKSTPRPPTSPAACPTVGALAAAIQAKPKPKPKKRKTKTKKRDHDAPPPPASACPSTQVDD